MSVDAYDPTPDAIRDLQIAIRRELRALDALRNDELAERRADRLRALAFDLEVLAGLPELLQERYFARVRHWHGAPQI